MKVKTKIALLLGSLLTCHAASADVIMHAFNWTYADVTAKATEIANAGYKVVLISPPQKSSGNDWWARYQPQDYRVIDNPLGNKQTLKTMIDTLAAKGVRVYADVVLNHMADESWKRSDLNYPGSEILSTYGQNLTYFNTQKLYGDLAVNFLSASDFHPAGCITNWDDPGNVQYWRLCSSGSSGLPDLDPNNWVVSQQQSYLSALKTLGIKGFRVDAVKHMTNTHLNAIFTATIISGMHVFGEVITSGGAGNSDYDKFLKPYLDNTSHGAYDFPLFNTMFNAFAYGGSMNQLYDPLTSGQALPGSRAVTFAITHDIPNNAVFRHQIMNQTDEKLAYAYILGRDGGTPMVYSDHNESNDGSRWVDYYKRADIKAMIKFHNAMSGKAMQMLSSNDCVVAFKRGKIGVVGINKCDTAQDLWVDTYQYEFDWNRTYRDVLDTTQTMQVTAQWHKLTIPARGVRMWIEE